MKDLDLSGKSKCIILVGKCGSGKSNLIRWLLLKNLVDKKFWKSALVFTNTKYSNEYDFLPDNYIIEGFNQELLNKYTDRLKKYKEKHNKVINNVIVFDDLIGLIKNREPEFINFLGVHRHIGCHLIFSFQHLNTGSSTLMKEITTHAICFNSKMTNTMESIWLNFGQLFDNFEHFKRNFFDICKEAYTACLYIADNNELDNNYFKIKAPDMTKKKYSKIKVEF